MTKRGSKHPTKDPTFTIPFDATEVIDLLWKHANKQGRLPRGVVGGERYSNGLSVTLNREGESETFFLCSRRSV